MRLINEDSVIDIVTYECGEWAGLAKEITKQIKALPSAPPEQRKWNVYYHMFNEFSYSCNYCGYSAPYQRIGGKFTQKKWRYCPNCGAMMVNAEE